MKNIVFDFICVLQFFKDRHYLDKEWGHHFSVSANDSDLVMLAKSVDSDCFLSFYREKEERWF